MKKIIITASTLLLLGGGITYAVSASSDPMPKATQDTEIERMTIEEDLEDTYERSVYDELDGNEEYLSFEEYETLIDVVGDKGKNAQIIKDNHAKRKILLMDDHGEPQFKSIYIKKKNRLKVVDFDGGLVFDQTLGNKAEDKANEAVVKEDVKVSEKESESETPAPKAESKTKEPKVKSETPAPKAESKTKEPKVKSEAPAPKAESKTKEPKVKSETPAPKTESKTEAPKQELGNIEEYNTLKNHVNVNDYTSQIVEDNPYKRVILLKDGHGKPQYKSIFVKKSNKLKIIKIRGGLVYNGIIQ